MSASNRAYGGRVPRGSIVVINFGMKVPKETAVHKRKREDECLSDKISKSDDIDNEPNVLNDIIKEVQTFQSNLLRNYSSKNKLELTDIINLIAKNIQSFVDDVDDESENSKIITDREYIINFLNTLILTLKSNLRMFACNLTEIFMCSLFFSVKNDSEQHSSLFLSVLEGLSNLLTLMKSGCGIEVYLMELLQSLEKVILCKKDERSDNESNSEMLLRKACESLDFLQILLSYSTITKQLSKYLIKTYLPIVTEVLEGRERFPFDNIKCQQKLRDLIVQLSVTMDDDHCSLRGLANDLLNHCSLADDRSTAIQQGFLRRINYPVAPPLCIPGDEGHSNANLFIES